ncbi:MAG: hypothetical protein A2542_00885 [Parcubacteria group bacterium RIFOXYD2_FULL_52_8]|nr:MAG: hypothetical protein A2542_00885 [Parcubacteria group bacterium RIFOXYD2_FULL_52_8]
MIQKPLVILKNQQTIKQREQFLPRVVFELAPLSMETRLLYNFSEPNRMFTNLMRKVYPELMRALEKTQDKEDALTVCRSFASQEIEENKAAIIASKEAIEQDWAQVSETFLATLALHMETSWPEDKKVITGHVSILPVCPRFLDKYAFTVNYRKEPAEARETIAHEILHFLWFKKWKEVFPEHKRAHYEAPHLVWRLSEVMDPIILQCHPEIHALIMPKGWGYTSFKQLRIGEVGMTQHFADIYKSEVNAGKSFADILRVLWEEAQKHEVTLGQF